jgi:AcrR family transcriptional regulator
VADVNRSRRYESPLRAQAAGQTRRAVLDAARELFVSQGYVATTVEQIARRAGVSKPTVFASGGSKKAIFKTLHDQAMAGDEEPAAVASRPWYQEALNEPDQRRSLQLHARNATSIALRAADLDQVLRMAAGADEELRQLWQTAEDQRRIGQGFVTDALLRKGPLKPGVGRDEAIDLLWTLTASDIYLRLVRLRGWPLDRFTQWLGDTFCDQILPRTAKSGRSAAG